MNDFIFNLQRFTDTVYGTSNSERINVTASEQLIYAYGGNDTVYNMKHNNVSINGGDGNDSIASWYSSNVSIIGGSGNDNIWTRGENATVSGGLGNDSLGSNGSNISLSGGFGDDSIEAGAGTNVSLEGGSDNDTIYLANNVAALVKYLSGDGNDTVTGFNENDTLQIASGSYTTTESGNDVIVKVGSGSILLRYAKGKTLNIKGSSDSGINQIYNSDDYKIIYGKSGKDSIYNSGDYVDISAGKGNDYIYSDFTNNVSIYGGVGNDTIDNYAGYGNDGNWTTLKGGTGKDSIRNFGGDSVISDGGSGDDNIYDYGHNNTIYGGTGRDYIYLDESEYSYIFGGSGNDTIISGSGDITGNTNYATISGEKGNDRISLSSDSYNNVIKYASGDGKDTVEGFNSDDILHITKGSYSVKMSGNDVIVTVGKGKITLKDARWQNISIKNSKGDVTTKYYGYSSSQTAELFAENNFVTADNLSEIVKNDLTATDYKIETQNFENLTQKNNLITFADK